MFTGVGGNGPDLNRNENIFVKQRSLLCILEEAPTKASTAEYLTLSHSYGIIWEVLEKYS